MKFVDVVVPINDRVYFFLQRYYTTKTVGENLLEAMNEGFVIAMGKNFRLAPFASEYIEKILAKEQDEKEYYYDDI